MNETFYFSDDTLKEQTERVLKTIETRAAETEKTENAELNSFETAYRAVHKKILTQKQMRKNLLAAQVSIQEILRSILLLVVLYLFLYLVLLGTY